MKFTPIYFLMIIFLFIASSVAQDTLDFAAYKKKIDQWHHKRVERLTRNDGWLSLAGLFWLKEGENRFGFGAANDIDFSDSEKPKTLGRFFVHNGKVRVKLARNSGVVIDGKAIRESELKSDAEGEPTHMERGRFLWYVIKRGDRLGIRLKDRENPAIKNFKGIERFPIRLKWRVKAKLIPYNPPKKVAVPTVLGTKALSLSPGELEFTVNGRTFRLQALADRPNESLFIIFADKTNGEQTYHAGRFLEVDPVNKKGETVIDFNKAYNPPCAFTEYATCPLPPRSNYLPIAVTAGEKMYRSAEHH